MAFQLRGNGLGEMDCSKTPNDPVCVAYYGTTPSPTNLITKYTYQKAILQSSLLNPQVYNAGANVVQTGSTGLPTTVAAVPSWWGRLSWFWKALAIGGGAFLGWKAYHKFSKKA